MLPDTRGSSTLGKIVCHRLQPFLVESPLADQSTFPLVKNFLYAFGDDEQPLPETVRVLDELVTDFVIETCHIAARSAAYSNRQKIKVDDFKFAIRGGELMLGRVQELLLLDKQLKATRRLMDTEAENKAALVDAAEFGGGPERGEGGRVKGKRGRRPKAAVVVEERR